jgi:glycosyltransferase involved in cell wall biosynthesis
MRPDGEVDVLHVLTYYAPYVSGLTETARVIAEELAARGKNVAVCAVRHDPGLPAVEDVAGVRVWRSGVLGRLSKGALSPGFSLDVARAARRARVVHLHLPMGDGALVARALPRRVPTAVTYHCDVNLTPGAVNRAIVAGVDLSSRAALRRADARVVTSESYAAACRVAAGLHRDGPPVQIPPPCRLREGGRPAYREGAGMHVGFLGRIVQEKGIQHLVEAFRGIEDEDARLLIAGEFENVAGGSVVDEVRAAAGSDPRIRLLGFVPGERLADLYASLDVFALPSVNSLEAFGIVQVEAMMAGVPVVASDLPGVRLPVSETGFGRLVPPGDAAALQQAIRAIRSAPPDPAGAVRARERYSLGAVVDAHEQLYERLGPPAASGLPAV